MLILLSDPRVAAVPVHDRGEPLHRLPADLGGPAWVRTGLATRLAEAARTLPPGLRLRVVEGHRSARAQGRIVADYTRILRQQYLTADDEELAVLASRFVSPIAVAPHVAGAAVDLTLVGRDGRDLDMGTPIDATPEQSEGRCYFAAEGIEEHARANRTVLADALTAAGLVNYPTEWWHWSYGDRYWALMTGADHALYGPVESTVAA